MAVSALIAHHTETLPEIIGEEDAKQIGIRLRLRIAEDELIDLYGIGNQSELLCRQ